MTSKKNFYENMQAMAKALASDRETKSRYAKASEGGREWMCLSRWIAEDKSRWNDQETMEYRDSLAAWLGSLDIVYVLQFETDADVVKYLKKRLVAAIKRETTKKRLKRRREIIERGLYKPWDGPEGMRSTSQAAAQYGRGCGMICMFHSAMKGDADYLRGNPPDPSFWTHPDCPRYLEWYNKYDAPNFNRLD